MNWREAQNFPDNTWVSAFHRWSCVVVVVEVVVDEVDDDEEEEVVLVLVVEAPVIGSDSLLKRTTSSTPLAGALTTGKPHCWYCQRPWLKWSFNSWRSWWSRSWPMSLGSSR